MILKDFLNKVPNNLSLRSQQIFKEYLMNNNWHKDEGKSQIAVTE